MVDRFESGEYDQVELAYTQFLSVGVAAGRRSAGSCRSTQAMIEQAADGPVGRLRVRARPEEILDRLLPRYAEARLFAALLDGAASFLAAQQRAMKSATDNAEELITQATAGS